ncbi:unnamed protein product [Sphagnum balticum]
MCQMSKATQPYVVVSGRNERATTAGVVVFGTKRRYSIRAKTRLARRAVMRRTISKQLQTDLKNKKRQNTEMNDIRQYKRRKKSFTAMTAKKPFTKRKSGLDPIKMMNIEMTKQRRGKKKKKAATTEEQMRKTAGTKRMHGTDKKRKDRERVEMKKPGNTNAKVNQHGRGKKEEAAAKNEPGRKTAGTE